MDTKEAPSCFRNSGPEAPAIPTFALMHYHRQFLLNDRVRDGNGCGQEPIVTGNFVPNAQSASGEGG